MLLTALGRARKRAVCITCMSNQKQVGLMAAMYSQMLQDSVQVSRDEALQSYLFENNTVTYDLVAFRPDPYKAAIKLTDADVERFLTTHAKEVEDRYKADERPLDPNRMYVLKHTTRIVTAEVDRAMNLNEIASAERKQVKVLQLINAHRDEIAFVKNTSEGIATVAAGWFTAARSAAAHRRGRARPVRAGAGAQGPRPFRRRDEPERDPDVRQSGAAPRRAGRPRPLARDRRGPARRAADGAQKSGTETTTFK